MDDVFWEHSQNFSKKVRNEAECSKSQKRKGGAERVREKKRKLLESDASKSQKLTTWFSTPKSDDKKISEPSTSEDENEVSSLENSPVEEEPVSDSLKTSKTMPEAEELENPISLQTVSLNLVQDQNSISPETEDSEINYFVRPKPEDMETFFKFHPFQLAHDPVVQKTFQRKDGSKRGWVSYSEEKQALFCMVCLAFSNSNENNSFTKGFTDKRHIHQRVEEHENSEYHKKHSEAYLLRRHHSDIKSLLFSNQMKIRQDQVLELRNVMERIVDVIKLIGKRGLSYRGSEETAYSLENENLDHGNFLEILLLLSRYDSCLKNHITKCIKKSAEAKRNNCVNEKKKTPRGRGNLVTLLSKNTVNSIIDVIGEQLKSVISKEVNEAQIFSIQIDTTQDVSCQDQCSIVVRYVLNEKINEKLLGIVRCHSTKGEALKNTLSEVLAKNNIQLNNCIGSSTDGAANMQGQYNGFSAKLITNHPEHVQVWCYAHILNLVMTDTTNSVISSATLFSLLNDISVFFRGSHLRMDAWEETAHDSRHRKLTNVGETRWWSKSKLLFKVFGVGDKKETSLYIVIIKTLEKIEKDPETNSETRVKAKSYKDGLLKYQTIITAFIFKAVYSVTTPLSNYLQTSGLDILKAFQLVQGTLQKLQEQRTMFEEIMERVNRFVEWVELTLLEEGIDSEVETEFPMKRTRRKKRMAGEEAQDEIIENPVKKFEVDVFLPIIDTCVTSIRNRFNPHSQTLYADLSILDPKGFKEIRNALKLPSKVFLELSKKLIKFNSNATAENLLNELIHLTNNWDSIKKSKLDAYEIEEFDSENEHDDKENTNELSSSTKLCNSCMDCCFCCYKLLNQYNLLTGCYPTLGLAYKFLLTLSFTQVACERSFSVLKYVKNRLRSKMNQSKLEAFMLMASEKDILLKLDINETIDKVANKSSLLKSLLIF